MNFRAGSVASENRARRGGGRRLWQDPSQGRQRSMARFSPQPEGTGRIFPIALSLVAKMFQHLPLLTSRALENPLPSLPS